MREEDAGDRAKAVQWERNAAHTRILTTNRENGPMAAMCAAATKASAARPRKRGDGVSQRIRGILKYLAGLGRRKRRG